MNTHQRVALADGYKYALLSLPRLNAITDHDEMTVAASGYALTRSLPVSEPESWRHTFGTDRYKHMAEAGNYLVVFCRSKRPEVLVGVTQ